MREEKKAEATPRPLPDLSLPEFQAAAKIKASGKLLEARAALTAFIQKYPSGQHAGEAQDLLGDVNTRSCSRIIRHRKKKNTSCAAATCWRGSRRR